MTFCPWICKSLRNSTDFRFWAATEGTSAADLDAISAAKETCLRLLREGPISFGLIEAHAVLSHGLDKNERLSAYFFDVDVRLVDVVNLAEGSTTQVTCQPSVVARYGISLKSTFAIICHSHPNALLALPSAQDLILTESLRDMLPTVGIHLLDDIIVAGVKTYSARASGDLVDKFGSATTAPAAFGEGRASDTERSQVNIARSLIASQWNSMPSPEDLRAVYRAWLGDRIGPGLGVVLLDLNLRPIRAKLVSGVSNRTLIEINCMAIADGAAAVDIVFHRCAVDTVFVRALDAALRHFDVLSIRAFSSSGSIDQIEFNAPAKNVTEMMVAAAPAPSTAQAAAPTF